ncbi:tRNA pseudouridine(55) synthase TruB [Flavobacteriales bacterium]|nr:tRNA pseudouridine(55) synthase TruB [Flavobacteriales bacterium]MDG1145333.1 tRNA pseudouridine(55) synthase TruB [Flavobacteriales bacterium]MDG1396466.1 tRNA pseudouridine(55) synthase TruB [Flavobacteriales bacterium]
MKKEFKFKEGEVLLFNKPIHWTSFQLVNKVRWLIKRELGVKKIKVGHAGTLDPLANGLLILCTGKMTKEIDQFQAAEKEYIATIKLGATTPSYDGEMEEDHFYATKHINEDLIKTTLQTFTGESQQYPPMFSALKVGGKKLYEIARKGNEVAVKPRSITISGLEILELDMPYIKFRVTCSKGTYIRSLAHDIGKTLKSGAWLYKLERTRIGKQTIQGAISLKEFEETMRS